MVQDQCMLDEFLAAISVEPDQPVHYAAAADWLYDQGHDKLADFVGNHLRSRKPFKSSGSNGYGWWNIDLSIWFQVASDTDNIPGLLWDCLTDSVYLQETTPFKWYKTVDLAKRALLRAVAEAYRTGAGK